MAMAAAGGVAGVQSSTSTSGPGFDLKTEAIDWAGMNEVPVVIFNFQRGGPATGQPTRPSWPICSKTILPHWSSCL